MLRGCQPRIPSQTILTVATLDRLRGFRVRTLGQLVQWGALMATCGLLLVLLLETTKSHSRVSNVHDYLKVRPTLRPHLHTFLSSGSQLRCMMHETRD